MSVGLVVVFVLVGFGMTVTVASPAIGARLAGRAMRREERALVAWGGLAVFCALFLLAVLVIGAHE